MAEALDVAGGGVASDNKAPDIVVTLEIFMGDMNHQWQIYGIGFPTLSTFLKIQPSWVGLIFKCGSWIV